MSCSSTTQLDCVSAAFALSAAVTVVFNPLRAWVKDAYEPLNKFMAHLSGHHWTMHGLADVLLFVVLGLVFLNFGAAGLGLAAWFVLF